MTTPTMYRYCTKEDDGLTEGAYCSCTAGYEIYACFSLFSILCLCSARTISSFCQTITFFGAISIHCGDRHPVSVMMNTLFLKCISCCCSTSSLGSMPPATTHLKIFRPGQPYRLSACHLSMQHNHGLTRTVLCLKNCIPSIMFIKPTRIHLKPNEGSLKFQSLKILS